mmetsp:Transcript_15041/g.17169  ORF Transcript_15041/g.17169 Transcript_15041/m.17169 type:complete len:701 (+) Transcript_15041:104-2206(+)
MNLSLHVSLLVSLVVQSLHCNASGHSLSNTFLINQSYKHHKNINEIAQTIKYEMVESFLKKTNTKRQKEIDVNEEMDKENDDVERLLSVDVSFSFIKDEGIEKVLDTLLSCDESDEPRCIPMSLDASMNHITPKGVSKLFNRLVQLAEKRVMDSNDTENYTTANPENNVTKSIEIEQLEKHTTNSSHVEIDTDEKLKSEKRHHIYMESINISLNDIGLHGVDTVHKTSETASFMKSIKKLIENESGLACPSILRIDNCGLGPPSCRSIGKGLINCENHILEKERNNPSSFKRLQQRRLEELYMSGNPISDEGATALAAALKVTSRTQNLPVIHTLDISSCHVGDVGAEALAYAIAGNPGCVKSLDLSNNRITDRGAKALGKALILSYKKLKDPMESLFLSNNDDIGDDGAASLFEAIESGALKCLSLRSCSIRADGASALGKTLAKLISQTKNKNISDISIDMSGNKLGTHVTKKKKGYSAYLDSMNSISQKGFGLFKSGLKDFVDFGGSSLESDDEAEEEDDSLKENEKHQISTKCGAILLYDSFVESIEATEDKEKNVENSGIRISLGLRMCNFDKPAFDAMAALSVYVEEKYHKAPISFDCTMNREIDNDVEDALACGKVGRARSSLLDIMANRHHAALEARRRAVEARKAENRLNGLFNDDYDDEDYDYDSNDSEDFLSSIFSGGSDYDAYDQYRY